MPSYADNYTDKKLDELEAQITKVYKQAQKEIEEKLDDFNQKFKQKDAEKQKEVADGKITKAEYQKWQELQVFVGKQWEQKKASIEKVLLNADKEAANLINGKALDVFAENSNFVAYELEQGTGMGGSFAIYDATTVSKLLKEEPELLPRRVINGQKADAWNRRQIANAITHGIIQGEGIPAISKRIAQETGLSNSKASILYARTAMTGAQNAGRQERLSEAKELGIQVKKRWLATRDSRTRDAHIHMDGQSVDVDKPFKSDFGDIMFPGDLSSSGSVGANVYNCRCTLVYDYPEFETGKRFATYEEWKNGQPDYVDVSKDGSQRQITYIPPSGYSETPKQTKYRNLNAIGYSDNEIHELEQILDEHTNGYEQQRKADKEILEHLSNNDRIGELIRDKSELEIQAWRLQIEEERRKALKDYEDRIESAKRDLEPGGIYYGYTEQDLKDWGVWPTEFDFQEPRFYRKGSMDGDVLAFSKSSSGAGMSFLTEGEEGYIGYDVSYTLSEMLEMGYRPIAGIMSADVGMPGEAEVLFVKMDTEPQQTQTVAHHIAQGTDISQTWTRRTDEFAFEIEDVVAAQGFDGLPRIVDADEFDRLVQQANNGNGFIAQRVYSAPNQETLDTYRQQLYEGKWYIDCHTGGSLYGQGMYCSADYTGTLSDGILMDMQSYKNLGESRYETHFDVSTARERKYAMAEKEGNAIIANGGSVEEARKKYDSIMSIRDNEWAEKYAPELLPTKGISYIETLTIDPSARIISSRDINDIRSGNLGLDYRFTVINELIEEAKLSKDASIFIRYNLGDDKISWNEVDAAAKALGAEGRQLAMAQVEKIGTEATKRYDEEHERRIKMAKYYQETYSDIGSLAAALGYDAINAENSGQSGSYTVILNRTKLIIRRPD